MKIRRNIILLVVVLSFFGIAMGNRPSKINKTLEDMVADVDDILIIDVRTEGEYIDGHIAGAVNMPFDDIQNLIGDVPKDKQLVVYCRSGRRSGIASNTLTDLGYNKILDYQRFSDWTGQVE